MIIKNSKKEITCPEDVYKIFKSILETEHETDQMKEHFWTIGLNTRNVIQYLELVSLGTLDANLAHPREIFRLAVMRHVSQIVLVHNHPSGDVEPSEGDISITHRLRKAGKILGVKVVDHIIIAKDEYFSFKEKRIW